MCKFIGVEILAANALIDILESGEGRSVSLEKLNECGIQVVDILAKKFNERAVVLYDSERIGNWVIDYSNFFELKNDILYVKENVTSEMLRERFRRPLSFEVFCAIVSSIQSIFKKH